MPAATNHAEAQPRGATPCPNSGGEATESARLSQHRSGREELPHVRGQGRRPKGGTVWPRLGKAAERSNPTSKEWWLHGCRRAKRSYSTFKVRRGGREEIPFVQGKELWLHFAGATVKRYPTSMVRETQVRCRCCKRASEGRHTETIITEN